MKIILKVNITNRLTLIISDFREYIILSINAENRNNRSKVGKNAKIILQLLNPVFLSYLIIIFGKYPSIRNLNLEIYNESLFSNPKNILSSP